MSPPRLTLVPKTEAPQHGGSPVDAPCDVPPPFTDPEAAAPAVIAEGANAAVETPDPGSMQTETDSEALAEGDPVSLLAAQDRREKLRIIEAILFAAPEPLSEQDIAQGLIEGADVASLLDELRQTYAARGINLTRVAGKWAFRTAEDLSYLLQRYAREERRLSKAALETLAIIAYHQPVTRAEIEEIRGVSTSAGTIDILLETGWIRPRGRRRAPGRPITYATTEDFLAHFGLDTVKDLPGLAELKGAGLLDSSLPPGFTVPEPRDVAELMPDELPLEDDDEAAAQGALDFMSHDEDHDGDAGDGDGSATRSEEPDDDKPAAPGVAPGPDPRGADPD